MAQFNYRALQKDGVVAEGSVEAGGRQEAFRLLEGRSLTPLSLKEGAASTVNQSVPDSIFRKRGRVNQKSLENFTRQLSGLLSAGVPLSRALRIITKEAGVPVAREKWREIHDLVVDGAALADAMARSPQVFPKVYVAMVQAGEMGGFLDVVLGQIADFQAREKELKGRVASALIYPAVLAGLSVAVLIFLLTFFIPRFQSIFTGFGAALPLLTRIIMIVSDYVTRYGIFAAILLGAGGVALHRWLKTDQGRRGWEKALLGLPVLGPLTARFAMTRFCRMLGTLIGAGVPLIQALRVARESIGNQTLVDAVSNSIDRVKQGHRLAESLSDCPKLFPGSVLEMISVAEETGRLGGELTRLATLTESDLDRQLRSAVALAEPALLFVMAAFIGTIVVGMVLPIFTIQDLIK
jgi:type II secretory pathway component PulF